MKKYKKINNELQNTKKQDSTTDDTFLQRLVLLSFSLSHFQNHALIQTYVPTAPPLRSSLLLFHHGS